ncbi:hypothetical protein [Chryseobacterium luteum]|uniref:hypothetical protein n=1 Tax=Chryseobacterium luteum TaxID=421531 RepID=UPI0013F4B1D7|nr:hypothetical protein [Chryseobacterium luteum]
MMTGMGISKALRSVGAENIISYASGGSDSPEMKEIHLLRPAAEEYLPKLYNTYL